MHDVVVGTLAFITLVGLGSVMVLAVWNLWKDAK